MAHHDINFTGCPVSWATNCMAYGQYRNIVGLNSGDDYDIPWVEFTDNGTFATSDERLSCDQNSAGELIYQTAFYVRTIDDLYGALVGQLVGGYYTNNLRYNPTQHPYMTGMYCKDIVHVKPKSTTGLVWNTGGTGGGTRSFSGYKIMDMHLNFETLPYPVGIPYIGSPGGETCDRMPTTDDEMKMSGFPTESGVNTQFNPNYIIDQGASSTLYVTSITGELLYNAGGKRVQHGIPTLQPVQKISWSIMKCDKGRIFANMGNTGTPIYGGRPIGVIADCIGTVNKYQFPSTQNNSGFAPGTLRLDNLEYSEPYGNPFGRITYDLTLNFTYNAFGHNKKQYEPGLYDYVVATRGDATTMIYPSKDFYPMMLQLNPF